MSLFSFFQTHPPRNIWTSRFIYWLRIGHSKPLFLLILILRYRVLPTSTATVPIFGVLISLNTLCYNIDASMQSKISALGVLLGIQLCKASIIDLLILFKGGICFNVRNICVFSRVFLFNSIKPALRMENLWVRFAARQKFFLPFLYLCTNAILSSIHFYNRYPRTWHQDGLRSKMKSSISDVCTHTFQKVTSPSFL